jgi:chromosome segregation protein
MEGCTVYLKEVALENFKSFGKKKRIPFLKGFTVITGPNGSGKSNIGDAILFVLGPKSSKAIRAGKLTNLIYNGGKGKKPARYCKVSLIFDNCDRTIPLEADEVMFTRHVKLSPSDPENYLSYFYVNERKSSLAEFDNLLSHAHISAEGYNLVKQGDITRIVEMGNVDRRRVLDEIAGIAHYDEDIKKAEDQRKAVEENLDRIGIIIDEIKKQLRSLEKERGSAMKYKELKDTYDLAKAQSAYKKKDMAESEIASIHNQIASYDKKEKEYEEKIAALRKELEELGEAMDACEEKIAREGGEESQQLKAKIDNLRIEIARAKDGISTSKDAQKALKREGKQQAEDLKALETELLKLQQSKQDTDVILAEKAVELKELNDEHDRTQEVVGRSDKEAANLQKMILTVNKEMESKEDGLRVLRIEEDRSSERMERLRSDIAELEEQKKTCEFEIKDVDFELSDLTKNSKASSKSLRTLQQTMEDTMGEEEKLYKESQELEAAITRLTREYNRLKAEAEAAESVRKGYNMAVSSILEARDRGSLKGIHGTIAELAEVEDRYEVALSIAAGARMQSIVVDNDECAAAAIEYLKKMKIGRATFLPLNKMNEGRPRGKALMANRNDSSLGFALDLVNFEPKYKAAFWYVLGDTVVVENLKTARKLMGGIRLVTLGGELIEAAGAMVGGKINNKHMKFGAPTQGDIDKVGSELRNAIAHADKISESLSAVKAEIIRLESQIRESGGKDDQSTFKIEALRSKRKEYRGKLSAVEKSLDSKTHELATVESTKEKLEEEVAGLEADIEGLKEARDGHRKGLMAATPQEYASNIKKMQKKIHDLTNEVTKLKSASDTMATQIKIHEERYTEIKTNIDVISRDQKGHASNIKNCTKKVSECENELSAVLKVEQSMNSEMRKLHGQRDELYKEKNSCEVAIDKVLTKVETNKDFIIGLRTKLKNAEEALEEIAAELSGFDAEFGPEEKLPTLEQLKETISSCERRMRNLEPINMKAIDDYDGQQGRYDELISEVKHLKSQRRNLLAVVKELDKKKKIEFDKVFVAINDNFKTIFAEMSFGGEAELLLENPDSPFEGGLLIKARPRGKKILRLESLSGGEKSLTALALIFAVQRYAPSPFYLLDEVDMFLDAINAEHVARMVKKNSRVAQFVMVSLRKVTLKEADCLYGVTMRGDSLSDVVGNVNLHDLEEEIPTLAADAEPREADSESTAQDEEPIISGGTEQLSETSGEAEEKGETNA